MLDKNDLSVSHCSVFSRFSIPRDKVQLHLSLILFCFLFVCFLLFYTICWTEVLRGKMVVFFFFLFFFFFFFFFLYSRHGVRLQVRAVRLLFVEQYVGFVGNDRSRWNDGYPTIVILMPLPRVWMLTIRRVMTRMRCARVIRDTVQIVRTTRNSGRGKGTEIQTCQWKIYHHV